MSMIFDTVDIEAIEKLASIVKEKGLSEISITNGESSVCIKGKKCVTTTVAAAPVQAVPVSAAAPSAEAPAKQSAAEEGNVVKSPIVGTFYQSPSPDKPPFVKVGDKVKKGDVIMIIESMKLMNEVQSEFDGTVERILVTDGQAVEFDQPIMIIK